jgi:predicted DNA-binding protein (UPF0251 family)
MVSSLTCAGYFKPAGVPLHFLEEVQLFMEEAEALRLKDIEGLEQADSAASMGVSRPTFQRILASAHRKVADALLNGKAIKIQGGHFKITAADFHCHHRGHGNGDGSRCCHHDVRSGETRPDTQEESIQVLNTEIEK